MQLYQLANIHLCLILEIYEVQEVPGMADSSATLFSKCVQAYSKNKNNTQIALNNCISTTPIDIATTSSPYDHRD